MKYNAVIRNIFARRSVREFKSEAIPRETLETIVLAGIYAPVARHVETRRFTVVQDISIIHSLEGEVKRAAARKEGYNFYGPAAFVLVSEDKENDNGLANCACALENMMLAAASLGVGSVWINQFRSVCGDSEIRKLLTSLEIPQDHIVWGGLSLGYPRVKPQPMKRDESVAGWF